jgi:hypothetical protein
MPATGAGPHRSTSTTLIAACLALAGCCFTPVTEIGDGGLRPVVGPREGCTAPRWAAEAGPPFTWSATDPSAYPEYVSVTLSSIDMCAAGTNPPEHLEGTLLIGDGPISPGIYLNADWNAPDRDPVPPTSQPGWATMRYCTKRPGEDCSSEFFSWCGQVEVDSFSDAGMSGSYNLVMKDVWGTYFPLTGGFSTRACAAPP